MVDTGCWSVGHAGRWFAVGVSTTPRTRVYHSRTSCPPLGHLMARIPAPARTRRSWLRLSGRAWVPAFEAGQNRRNGYRPLKGVFPAWPGKGPLQRAVEAGAVAGMGDFRGDRAGELVRPRRRLRRVFRALPRA